MIFKTIVFVWLLWLTWVIHGADEDEDEDDDDDFTTPISTFCWPFC